MGNRASRKRGRMREKGEGMEKGERREEGKKNGTRRGWRRERRTVGWLA